VESEPPGADARTVQGQACRTPCELTVPAGAETAISFALTGYQPQTVPVRAEIPPGMADPGLSPRLQPNPVYAELQPVGRQQRKKGPAKKKATAQQNIQQPSQSQASSPDSNSVYPGGFAWPDPIPR
jgi:hypothetical protein